MREQISAGAITAAPHQTKIQTDPNGVRLERVAWYNGVTINRRISSWFFAPIPFVHRVSRWNVHRDDTLLLRLGFLRCEEFKSIVKYIKSETYRLLYPVYISLLYSWNVYEDDSLILRLGFVLCSSNLTFCSVNFLNLCQLLYIL